MKIFTDKSVTQKIIIALVIVILTTFSAPTAVQADAGGKLMNPILNLIVALFDGVQHLLEYAMLGETSPFMKDIGSGDYEDTAGGVTITTDEFIDATFFGLNAVNVPKITYTPEAIFSNKVPALDVNFINPSVQGNDERNVAVKLQPVIASWYVAIRTMSIVGLLSVLVYLGIRMLLSSLAADRAKYKQMLFDWVVAMCLVFALHYIMSFALTMAETVTAMISSDAEGMFTVNATKIDGLGFSTYGITFGANLMSYVRFMIQAGDLNVKIAFFALYIMLVIYSVRFTWVYLKRVVNMAFLTLIAPMVALTYPIDKVSDGKAQAFNMWMKEFTYNALIQPLHLLLYVVLLGSAIQLAADNPIYAIVCLGFIIAAEKLMKSMFGFGKASGGTLGSLAGAAGVTAIASKALNTGASQLMGGKGGSGGNGKVRTKDGGYQRQGKDNGVNKDYDSFDRAGATGIPGMMTDDDDERSKTLSPEEAAKREEEYRKKHGDKEELPPPSDNDKGKDSSTSDDNDQNNLPPVDPSAQGQQGDTGDDYDDFYDDLQHYNDDEDEKEEDYNDPYFDQAKDNNPVTDGSPLPKETEATLKNLKDAEDIENKDDTDNTDDTDNSDNNEETDGKEVAPRITAKQQKKQLRRQNAKLTLKGVAAGAGTLAYTAARGTLKAVPKVAMGAALAGMAGIIGATTGDGEKAMSMAAGAYVLGSSAGGKMFESTAGKLMKQKSARDSYDRAKYGSRTDAQNARADKEFLKSDEFNDYYDKFFKGKYSKKEVKETFSSYRKAGITDNTTIRKAMKLEEQYKKRYMDNAKMTDVQAAEQARLNVQNIVQTKGDVDGRAFVNKEAKQRELERIAGSLTNVEEKQRMSVARQIFRGYEDFRKL